MKKVFDSVLQLIPACLIFPLCQVAVAQTASEKKLFDREEVIQVTLKGDLRPVLNDRTGKPKKHPAVLAFYNEDKSETSFPVELQTRGNFRRMKENCGYPPLWIHFPKTREHHNSLFADQVKTKLVMPCGADEYIIREWLVYKLYNLFSPASFRARLVKVKLEDPKMKKQPDPFFALLLEEEKQMAKRNNMLAVEKKLRPEETQIDPFLMMAVFEYMVGNTDWSVQYLHNVKLLVKDKNALPITVPYDFDHAGIVDAPYAQPAEQLQMRSIKERRFRGYCITNLKQFEAVNEKFISLKNDIYTLYKNCEWLDAKYVKNALQFLDDFYETINTPKYWQRDFSYPCDPNGIGNIVIKGLKEN